jgi:hypothetical protein
MADDRMKNDDRQRNMGNKEDQDFGRQAPGRSGQSGQQGGQSSGQQGSGNLNEDDDMDTGGAGKTGGQNRGGQNR